jgi:hypothetical protein
MAIDNVVLVVAAEETTKKTDDQNNDNIDASIKNVPVRPFDEETATCPFCCEDEWGMSKTLVTLPECSHRMHLACILDYARHVGRQHFASAIACPICRVEVVSAGTFATNNNQVGAGTLRKMNFETPQKVTRHPLLH